MTSINIDPSARAAVDAYQNRRPHRKESDLLFSKTHIDALKAEVKRLEGLVAIRNAEREAAKLEAELSAQIAELRKDLGF